jgi:hypothetical protein
MHETCATVAASINLGSFTLLQIHGQGKPYHPQLCSPLYINPVSGKSVIKSSFFQLTPAPV